MDNADACQIVGHATMIGDLLEKNHPRVMLDGTGCGAVPKADVKDVAGVITMVVAQILQSWLDAGSERDVTMEELGPVIEEHVDGWAA